MIQQTKWFDRTFDFDFPLGLFPCILERLSGTPARLEELVLTAPTKILTARVDGKWSIQEHIGHLYDLEELHDGRINDYRAGATALRAADVNNKKTEEAHHNTKPIHLLLQQFRQSREQFVQHLTSLNEEILTFTALHPRLQQQMRAIDLAYFVAEHDDHHIARMRAILQTLNKKPG